MLVAEEVAASAVLILAWLKVVELLRGSIWWALTSDRGALCDRFEAASRSGGDCFAVLEGSDFRPYVITAYLLGRLRRWPRLALVLRVATMWPLLVVGLSVATEAFPADSWIQWGLLATLAALLSTKVAHRLVCRLFLGVVDNIHWDVFALRPVVRDLTVSRIARKICVDLAFDIYGITIGFGAIYYLLERWDSRAFAPESSPLSVVQSLHFSFVTSTTTGYGDIYPLSGVAQVASIAHMIAVWTVVAVIALHYGLTLSEVDGKGPRTRGLPESSGAGAIRRGHESGSRVPDEGAD